MAAEREQADVEVKIHPKVRHLLQQGRWSQARHFAIESRDALVSDGYQPDGIKLTAGESWTRPYEPRERRR
jgi:hypothetical protein